jgi:hypothetical protein
LIEFLVLFAHKLLKLLYISKKVVIERKDVTMKQLTVLLLGVDGMGSALENGNWQ